MNFAKTRRIKKGAPERNRALTAGHVAGDLKEKERKWAQRGQIMARYVAHSIRRIVQPVKEGEIPKPVITVLAFSHPTKKASRGRRGLIIT